MTWDFFADRIETADVGTIAAAQKFNPNKDIFVRDIRIGMVMHDASFTTLGLKIHAIRAGGLGKLIATSTTTFTPSQITTLNFARKQINFDFDDIPLKGTDDYFLLLDLVGYTGSALNHIAWVKDQPVPIQSTGITVTFEGIHVSPREFNINSSEI